VENIRARQERSMNAEIQLDRSLGSYRSRHGRNFNLMLFFVKLKSCEKWHLTYFSLKKVVDTVIDLEF
jgi:hypothetical protein